MTARLRRQSRTLPELSRSTASNRRPAGGGPSPAITVSTESKTSRASSRQCDRRYWNSGDSALSSASVLTTRRSAIPPSYNPGRVRANRSSRRPVGEAPAAAGPRRFGAGLLRARVEPVVHQRGLPPHPVPRREPAVAAPPLPLRRPVAGDLGGQLLPDVRHASLRARDRGVRRPSARLQRGSSAGAR